MSAEITTAPGQGVSVIDRSRSISENLRQMARVSRFRDARGGPRSGHVIGGRRDFVTPVLFVCFFLLPALAGTLYFGLIASDRFITESRFAIRPAIGGAEKATPDAVGATLGIPQAMIVQDTLIVMDYIHSRPMIEALERQFPLKAMFSRDGIDYPSRFDSEKPIEKFIKYWKDRVHLAVDSHSGIVTVDVTAFDPQESLALNKAILAESERMINDLTTRARNNALEETRRELARAEERMLKLRVAMRDLRNKDGVLDGQRTAEASLKMVNEIRLQRIQLQVKQGTLGRDLSSESRSMQELTSQIRQLDDTIAKIERQTTNTDPEQRAVLSATLGRFEELETERRNAEKYYGSMIAAQERAKIIAERQLEFFSPVVEPVLAASPQAPRRLLSIALVLVAAGLAFTAALFVRKTVAA